MRSRFDHRFKKPSRALSGVLLMILHALSMSFVYVLTKQINQSLHPFQTAFLYKLLIFVGLLPYCIIGGIKKNLKTKRIGLHIARATFSCLATVSFFVAIKEIPVSNAAAISYLQHILITLIGFFLFKEVLHRGKIVMIIMGCLGALMITKPGSIEFNKYYFFIFLADFFWALNSTVIKVLGSTERNKTQLFYVFAFSTLFTLPQGVYEWKAIPTELWASLFLLAMFYLIHSVAYFKAFKYGEMSLIMPYDYTRVLFSSILATMVLQETLPDEYTALGYLLIIIGGVYSIKQEAQRKRAAAELEITV